MENVAFVPSQFVGEYHESIKAIIEFLIEYYLFTQGIEFFPVGSATRESKEKRQSKNLLPHQNRSKYQFFGRHLF